jgi:hypothetical protein
MGWYGLSIGGIGGPLSVQLLNLAPGVLDWSFDSMPALARGISCVRGSPSRQRRAVSHRRSNVRL